jgi:cytochrome oxidase Cu insertion factor (SCO1/SenC/PrrC family)
LRCPIIGICLDGAEEKKLLKKAGISAKKLNPYEIHTMLVHSVDPESDLSRKVDSYLNHKFVREIVEFSHLPESEFRAQWKRFFRQGEWYGLVWVAGTRTDLSPECRQAIFGDIHMLSHSSAREETRARQALIRQQEENEELAEKLKKEVRARREFKKERDALERVQGKVRGEYEKIKKAKSKLEKEMYDLQKDAGVSRLQLEVEQLQMNLEQAEKDNIKKEHRIHSLEDQKKQLSLELEEQRELTRNLHEEVKRTVAQMNSSNQCDQECPEFDLCAKRILIVGGMTKLKSFYRQLVEEKGGLFEYHDGAMHGGVNGLEGKVTRSDLILFPVSCNSHNACSSVKKLAQKHGKVVRMLPNASLSCIAQALFNGGRLNG